MPCLITRISHSVLSNPPDFGRAYPVDDLKVVLTLAETSHLLYLVFTKLQMAWALQSILLVFAGSSYFLRAECSTKTCTLALPSTNKANVSITSTRTNTRK
jgi:hypothetical protein